MDATRAQVLDTPNVREYVLCQELAEQAQTLVLLIGGVPGYKDVPHYEYHLRKFDYDIAVFAPDMVLNGWGDRPFPTGIQANIMLDAAWPSRLVEEHYTSSARLYGFCWEKYGDQENFPQRGEALALIELDKQYYRKHYGKEHPSWLYGITEQGCHFCRLSYDSCLALAVSDNSQGEYEDRILVSLLKARQARFEHGEMPRL